MLQNHLVHEKHTSTDYNRRAYFWNNDMLLLSFYIEILFCKVDFYNEISLCVWAGHEWFANMGMGMEVH